jgi:hypothetical protein
MKNKIMHKSRLYTLIGDLLYFCGRDGILWQTVEKNLVPKLLYEFYDCFCRGRFASQITTKNI